MLNVYFFFIVIKRDVKFIFLKLWVFDLFVLKRYVLSFVVEVVCRCSEGRK